MLKAARDILQINLTPDGASGQHFGSTPLRQHVLGGEGRHRKCRVGDWSSRRGDGMLIDSTADMDRRRWQRKRKIDALLLRCL